MKSGNSIIHEVVLVSLRCVYHIIDASEEKIEKSIEALHEVDWIFAGHCTGFDGLRRIANEHGKRFARIHTGSMIRFPIKDASNPISTIPTVERDIHRSYQE